MYRDRKWELWSGKFSRLFRTRNGIQQGGVVSPVLFCVYGHLAEEIRVWRIWLLDGHHYYGSVVYADDLKLLSPTIHGLRKMTVICEEFGEEYGVQCNPTRIVYILYAKKASNDKSRVDLCGTKLQWVNDVKHLGNYVHRQQFKGNVWNKK